MTARTQRLQAVLQAREQVASGAVDAEQVLTRLVWEILEPQYRAVMGMAVASPTITSADVCAKLKTNANQAAGILRQLADDGLLIREPHVDERGLCYRYHAADWMKNV